MNKYFVIQEDGSLKFYNKDKDSRKIDFVAKLAAQEEEKKNKDK